jgi:hypothetical protein
MSDSKYYSHYQGGAGSTIGYQTTTNGGDYGDKLLITELNVGGQEHSFAPVREELKRPQTDESERGTADNQIFHVLEAVPPTDFDAPYSKLPNNVVLTRVKVGLLLMLIEYRKMLVNH